MCKLGKASLIANMRRWLQKQLVNSIFRCDVNVRNTPTARRVKNLYSELRKGFLWKGKILNGYFLSQSSFHHLEAMLRTKWNPIIFSGPLVFFWTPFLLNKTADFHENWLTPQLFSLVCKSTKIKSHSFPLLILDGNWVFVSSWRALETADSVIVCFFALLQVSSHKYKFQWDEQAKPLVWKILLPD